MSTTLFRVNVWALSNSIFMFALTGTRKVLVVSEFTLQLLDDDIFRKQTLAQAGSGRENPEQTWWIHIWSIETNSQDLHSSSLSCTTCMQTNCT